MKRKWIFIAPLAILGMVLFVFVGGTIVMQLWNWLLPPLFGWPQLTFWQALALLALCRILFGGLGRYGGSNSMMRRRVVERMADRVALRMEHMTPEERERFRQRMRDTCGFDPATSEEKGP